MGRGDVDGARDGSCIKLNTPHATRHTPHITRHTSQVTIHASSLGFDFKLRCYFSADIGDSSLEGEHTSTQKRRKRSRRGAWKLSQLPVSLTRSSYLRRVREGGERCWNERSTRLIACDECVIADGTWSAHMLRGTTMRPATNCSGK